MSALDAGYDVHSSGVTLDRFCGSGITAVNFAGLDHHVRHVRPGRRRRHRDDERQRPPAADAGASPVFDSGNMRLRASHPQTQQGICADAIATMEGITRDAVDELALESQQRAAIAIDEGRFDQEPGPRSTTRTARWRSTGRSSRARRPPPRASPALKPSFEAMADIAVDDDGHHLPAA